MKFTFLINTSLRSVLGSMLAVELLHVKAGSFVQMRLFTDIMASNDRKDIVWDNFV